LFFPSLPLKTLHVFGHACISELHKFFEDSFRTNRFIDFFQIHRQTNVGGWKEQRPIDFHQINYISYKNEINK
jgi:hypothetical protein